MIFLDILDVVSVGEDRGESPELASFFLEVLLSQ